MNRSDANVAPYIHRILLLVLAILAVAICGTATAKKKQAPPQTTPDGLNLVTNTKQRLVYMADDVDLSVYSKVAILDCPVAFKKNWQRDYNRNERDLQLQVRDKDMDRIKKTLATEFKETFTTVMQEKGHDVVDTVGSDVLVLRPAIVNLVVTAPDLRTAGMSQSFTADAGQMTLYLELYDSVTSSKLAEVMDAEDAGRTGQRFQISNSVTNKAAADRMLRAWANELADHLGAAKAVENTGDAAAGSESEGDSSDNSEG